MTCKVCNDREASHAAVIANVYYPQLCALCRIKLSGDSSFSSGYQSFTRRRGFEDMAQDAVQPYDAAGKPRSEFYRLYPRQAAKIFTKDEISEVKRKL